jgi:ParB family chromosome partitioning protein
MDIDEKNIAEIALIENLQRKDLNIWEEADGLAALASKFSYTQDEIAKKISKSRSTVTELMTVAGLPSDIRAICREAGINSKSTLLEIARQFDDAAMHEFLDGLISGKVQPKTKQPKGETSSVTANRSSGVGETIFEYSGKGFRLLIDFKGADAATRPEILKALKETFDSVKAGSTS